jgi:hypothetical protein
VLLRGGTYSITATLQITQTGLTFASYPGERARIVAGTSDVTNLTSVILVYAGGVTLERLELEGASYYGVKLDDRYGPLPGIKLRGLYVHHTGRDGLKVQKADGVIIEDCEIAFTGVRDASNAEGIDVMATIGVTIRRNYIHDIATNGLFVKAGTRQAIVDANVVERTGYSGILLGSESGAEFMRDGALQEAMDSVARNNIIIDTAYAGLGSIAGDNIRFENNTVIRAARVGQAAFRAAPNEYATATRRVVLLNNIFTMAPGSTRPLVHLFHYDGIPESDGNIWFSPDGRYQFWREAASGASNYWTSFSQWQTGMNIDWASYAVDPRLDAAALFRPLADSPAIDRGLTNPGLFIDYSGGVRPQGLGYDIGAHEHPVVAPPPPPPPPTDPSPTPVLVPSTPATVVAVQTSVTSVGLTWTDTSDNEQGFRIERALGTGSFVVIATVAPGTQKFSSTGLKAGKVYRYRLVAFNAAGASSYSNVASVTLSKLF